MESLLIFVAGAAGGLVFGTALYVALCVVVSSRQASPRATRHRARDGGDSLGQVRLPSAF